MAARVVGLIALVVGTIILLLALSWLTLAQGDESRKPAPTPMCCNECVDACKRSQRACDECLRRCKPKPCEPLYFTYQESIPSLYSSMNW